MVFWLSACVGGNTHANQKLTEQASSAYILETSSLQATKAENTAIPISDMTQYKIPVAITWFQEHGQGLQIVSVLLGQDMEYPLISIEEKKTVFLGPAAIDSQSNLYLIYGHKDNYISKLSLDGTITTKHVPFDKSSQAVWIGETLVVVPLHSTKPTYIVDTQLNIKEITPSLNVDTDAIPGNIGFLGIADAANNLAIWVFSRPVRTDSGFFAHYRLLDLSSGKVIDNLLPIPAFVENFTPDNDPDGRLGTQVYGVDPFSESLLLCYGKYTGNNTVISILDLYSSKSGKSIDQQERCCLNNIFDLRGDTFIENLAPESCSGQTIQNWSDMESTIATQQFLSGSKPSNDWIVSNGIYWAIKSNQSLAVFNTFKLLESEYDLPDDLANNLRNASTFQIGLAIKPH